MTPFEQHIDDCIASEVGLAQALQRDGFGDYTVPWVASKHKAWQAGREAALEEAAMAAESGFKYALDGYQIADKIRSLKS